MDDRVNRSSLVVGVILVLAGLLFFASRFFQLPSWESYWQLAIVLLGALFFIGMLAGGRKSAGLAIPASILMTVGPILFVQSWFNLYETWAYAWALIICAVGFGILIAGLWGQQPEQRRGGWRLMGLGALLFLVFGAFFELVFSYTGVHPPMPYFWAVALLLVGLVLFFTRLSRLAFSRENARRIDRDLFWPVLIAGSGLVWLLVDLQRLPYANLAALAGLWPVLLIVAGLDLLIGRRFPVLGALLAAALVAGVIWFSLYPLAISAAGMVPFRLPQPAGQVERVIGSGNLTSQSHDVFGYNAIDLSAGGIAELVQDGQQGLEVTGDDNLLPYLLIQVRGGELQIGVKPGYSLAPSQSFRYKIHVKELRSLSTSGAGEFDMPKVNGETLSLESSGFGKVIIQELQVNRLNLDVSGSGVLELGGSAAELHADLSGAALVDASDLQINRAYLKVSGAGKLVLWVVKSLEVYASGAADISYYGGPAVEQHVDAGVSLKALGSK